jgi:hypothetical protein
MGSLFLSRALVGFLKAVAVVAPVGDEVQVRMATERPIAEALNVNDRVARMVLPETGMVSFLSLSVKGVSPGIDPLVFTDDKGKSQLFLVVVPKPKS